MPASTARHCFDGSRHDDRCRSVRPRRPPGRRRHSRVISSRHPWPRARPRPSRHDRPARRDRPAAQRDHPGAVVQRQRPATHAAAISPCEWPTTASGRRRATPQRRPATTITANSTGCTTSTRSSSPRPRHAARRCSDQSTCGASARGALGDPLGEHRRGRPAARRPCRPTAIPGRGTRTRLAPTPAAAGDDDRRGVPSASAPARGSSSRSRPTTTARCSNARPRSSTSDQRDVGERHPRRRARPASRRGLSAQRSALRADSNHGTGSAAAARGSPALGFVGRRLLEDHVRVGPADAERRHRRPARTPGLGPVGRPRSAADRAGGPVHLRRRLVRRAALRAARRAASPAPS